MQDFIKEIPKRTSVFAIVVGAILIVIGAASEFTVSTVSLKIPDLIGRGIVVVIGLVLLGFGIYLELRGPSNTKKEQVKPKDSEENQKGNKLLQRINFKYRDSPANHGWKIFCDGEQTQPGFYYLSDGFYGDVLQIQSSFNCGMDFSVGPVAQLGQKFECVTKIKNEYGLYAKVNVQSKDGSKRKDVWLNFQIGEGPSRPFSSLRDEWIVYTTPDQAEGEWSVFQVDLKDIVTNSLGKEGWSYRKLRGFRLRGSLQIAYISIW